MAVSTLFSRLARWRGAPAFHPRGVLMAARVAVTDPGSGLAAALDGQLRVPAIVRLSKGVGTPAGWPDLLGFAVRLARPARAPLDLLFTTTGRHRGTDALLLPARRWTDRPYSTLLPYRVPRGYAVLRVVPDPGTSVRFTLQEGHRAAGSIELLHEEPGDVAFDPVHHADPALTPVALTALRARAYRGSRAGRRAGGLERVPDPTPG